MTISITSPEAERLARELARATGASVDEAVASALRDKLKRIGPMAPERPPPTREEAEATSRSILEIARRVAALPDLDPRTPEEILEDAFDLPLDGHR